MSSQTSGITSLENLRDYVYWGEEYCLPPNMVEAAEELERLYNRGQIKAVSLMNYGVKEEMGAAPLTLERNEKKQNCPYSSGKLYTSSYVGSCVINGIPISIKPHFGKKVMTHMLACAANIHITERDANIAFNSGDASWLLALVWKAALTRALESSHIPKAYVEREKNIRTFRGRLNIPLHIRRNMTDASRFYCRYRELTPDNMINRVILAVLRIFNRNYGKLMREFYNYAERLVAFGVAEDKIEPEDIDKITYTRANEIYKPLMALSKIALERGGGTVEADKSAQDSAFFVNMAEIWELYLLRVLKKGLGGMEYAIESGNAPGREEFLLSNRRRLRPDIVIKKNGRVVLVIDAKYKRYTEFGAAAFTKNGAEIYNVVSTSDLYQLTTYLYHYGSHAITGILSAPANMRHDEGDIFDVVNHPGARVGLLNLEIDKCMDNKVEPRDLEMAYVARIKSLLQETKDN